MIVEREHPDNFIRESEYFPTTSGIRLGIRPGFIVFAIPESLFGNEEIDKIRQVVVYTVSEEVPPDLEGLKPSVLEQCIQELDDYRVKNTNVFQPRVELTVDIIRKRLDNVLQTKKPPQKTIPGVDVSSHVR
ncbi:MAG: hypothetical protein Q8P10_01015 [bacterium]|nr:hypothetical protein [bacterium]